MRFLSKALTIVWKDVIAEFRTREMFASMFVFTLLLIVVFSFSFDLRVEKISEVLPGVLWVTLAFASTLQLNRSLALEVEEARFDGLLLAPLERSTIYFGKMLGNLLFISVLAALMLPIFSAVFDINLIRVDLLLTVFLGTIGIAAVGTLLSTMAVNSRAREVLLPVLLFPIILPVVLSAVKITASIVDSQPWSSVAFWLRLLIGFDVIFLTLSYLTFDYVVQG